MNFPGSRYVWLMLAMALCVGGCKKDPQYTLVPASGTLKIDNRPAANVMVQAMPDIMAKVNGPTSQGITDENGNFTLTTVNNEPGAVVGKHVIVLFDLSIERVPQDQTPKPARFSSAYGTAKGGIPFEIQEGKPIELNIKSGG